jgi:hypothetical protein
MPSNNNNNNNNDWVDIGKEESNAAPQSRRHRVGGPPSAQQTKAEKKREKMRKQAKARNNILKQYPHASKSGPSRIVVYDDDDVLIFSGTVDEFKAWQDAMELGAPFVSVDKPTFGKPSLKPESEPQPFTERCWLGNSNLTSYALNKMAQEPRGQARQNQKSHKVALNSLKKMNLDATLREMEEAEQRKMDRGPGATTNVLIKSKQNRNARNAEVKKKERANGARQRWQKALKFVKSKLPKKTNYGQASIESELLKARGRREGSDNGEKAVVSPTTTDLLRSRERVAAQLANNNDTQRDIVSGPNYNNLIELQEGIFGEEGGGAGAGAVAVAHEPSIAPWWLSKFLGKKYGGGRLSKKKKKRLSKKQKKILRRSKRRSKRSRM